MTSDMSTVLFFLFQLFFSVLLFVRGGELISCVCTTTHCRKQQVSTCNTTSMCFSQYLDRQDGSDPVVKGCITSKTPLLCENRRPALHHRASWPVLSCCNRNLCNRDTEPTPPALLKTTDGNGNNLSTFSSSNNLSDWKEGRVVVTEDNKERIVEGKPTRIFNSIYIVVLVAGICCLLLIGGVATLVLKRQSALYDQEFGSIHRNGYLKGEPRERAPSDTQPKPIGRTYDNKLALNT